MKRTRRRFVVGIVAGVGTLLAGCTGSSESGDGSTATATDGSDDSTPEATTSGSSATVEPTSSGRTDSPTETPTRGTNSSITEFSSPSSGSSMSETGIPQAPTSPTTDLQIVSQNGPLTITEIEVGPPGTDPPSVFRESVDFENTTNDSLDLAGYVVEYGGTGKSFEIPNWPLKSEIDASETLRVTTGAGGETIDPGEHEFFAGFERPVLKSGNVITVTDPDGKTVLKARY